MGPRKRFYLNGNKEYPNSKKKKSEKVHAEPQRSELLGLKNVFSWNLKHGKTEEGISGEIKIFSKRNHCCNKPGTAQVGTISKTQK